MTNSLLIVNERSGSFDAALAARIEALFREAGRPFARRLALGDAALPDAAAADKEGLGLVVILSGDGSISAAANALAGWEGDLLVLPGGTMNLLARALHGDLGAPEIAEAWLAGRGRAFPVPTIRAGEATAYCGIMAGPTALWGDVREDLRNRDLASLGETIPRALGATFDAPGVRIAGQAQEFPAIYLEPWPDGIHGYGVQASGAGDLVRHGFAWLKGDFRDGPLEPIAVADALDLESDGRQMELLVDGERGDAPAPLRARAVRSGVRFHSVRGELAWR